MNLKKTLYIALLIILAISCGKDDGPSTPPVEENNAPVITAQSFTAAENIASGQNIENVIASDADEDTLEFSLNDTSPFTISKSGTLSLANGQSLDFETTQQYEITVSVTDGQESASAKVTVSITDIDEAPVFSQESFQFPANEDIDQSVLIGTITAEDPENGTLEYAITDSELFTINSETGAITLIENAALDFESVPSHTFTVQVSDGANSASVAVTISLNDGDEFPVFDEESYDFAKDENIPDTELIGTVSATDPEGQILEYDIVSNNSDLFIINPETGEIRLAEGHALNFEENDTHDLIVQASDGTNMVQVQVTITVNDIDEAPSFGQANYNFNADEDIADTDLIGTVTAMDPEGSILSYEIVTNDNGLFEIDPNSGEVSLSNGQNLDFEGFNGQNPIHIIKVAVSDGTNANEATVTLTVEDVAEAHPDDKAAFVTTWQAGNNETITIGINPELTYDFTINWGDGTIEQIIDPNNPFEIEHTYENAGTYSVSIIGTFPAMQMQQDDSGENLLTVEHWGNIQWGSMHRMFNYCTNMVFNANINDVPNLSNVEDMKDMFFEASLFNGDLSDWNTENVTNMGNMFRYASNFNGNLSTWNTENVTDMSFMFFATNFDQNIGNWNISSLSDANSILRATNISPENYAQTLIGWASQAPNIQNGVLLTAQGAKYSNTPEVQAARQTLEVDHGWTITDDGPEN